MVRRPSEKYGHGYHVTATNEGGVQCMHANIAMFHLEEGLEAVELYMVNAMPCAVHVLVEEHMRQ